MKVPTSLTPTSLFSLLAKFTELKVLVSLITSDFYCSLSLLSFPGALSIKATATAAFTRKDLDTQSFVDCFSILLLYISCNIFSDVVSESYVFVVFIPLSPIKELKGLFSHNPLSRLQSLSLKYPLLINLLLIGFHFKFCPIHLTSLDFDLKTSTYTF